MSEGMAMSRPMSVARKIKAMPLARFAASFKPVCPTSLKTVIMPAMVPTRPSNGAMPTMISSTTRPRSSRTISWRAAVWSASTLSAFGRSRLLAASSRRRPSGDGFCSQTRHRAPGAPRWFLLADPAQGFHVVTRPAFGQRPGDFPGHDFVPAQHEAAFHDERQPNNRGQPQQEVNEFAHKILIIIKCERDFTVILADQLMHILRPRFERRGIVDGLLADVTEQVADGVFQDGHVGNGPVVIQVEPQHDLAGAVQRELLAVEQGIPAIGHGVHELAVILSERRRLHVK